MMGSIPQRETDFRMRVRWRGCSFRNDERQADADAMMAKAPLPAIKL
jgi:hypothetical protein